MRTPRALLLGAACLAATACSEQAAGPPPSRPVPVTAARAAKKSVPVVLTAIGNVEPYSTVWVKSQVNGKIETVHFREGADVKKGDLLFTIDRRPFQAALSELEAKLAGDKARAETAEIQRKRNAALLEEKVVPPDQYDQSRATAEALQAQVQMDEAALERARLDLAYCTITSPMDGRTGSLKGYAGNLVKANDDSALVVINQIQPIYVSFSPSEKHLPEIAKQRAEGDVRVRAVVQGAAASPEPGLLTFVDNAVDPLTGTIRLKATFANESRLLWPGQFVNVIVELRTRPDAVVVPSQAVMAGQSGSYVFVVKPDRTAESRPVTTGDTLEGETVIEKGLVAGEEIVTDGQLRLMNGSKVETAVPGATPAPASSPSGNPASASR
jgi:multidrug efflux system membrane fusion protein